MRKRKQPFNPFYVLLIVVGVAFTITACGYALMMLRATRPVPSDSAEATSTLEETGLMRLLDERGMEIMGVEVLLLTVATVGAIGLDRWRGTRESSEPSEVGGVRPKDRIGAIDEP